MGPNHPPNQILLNNSPFQCLHQSCPVQRALLWPPPQTSPPIPPLLSNKMPILPILSKTPTVIYNKSPPPPLWLQHQHQEVAAAAPPPPPCSSPTMSPGTGVGS